MPDDVQPPGPADVIGHVSVTASLDVTPAPDPDGDGG